MPLPIVPFMTLPIVPSWLSPLSSLTLPIVLFMPLPIVPSMLLPIVPSDSPHCPLYASPHCPLYVSPHCTLYDSPHYSSVSWCKIVNIWTHVLGIAGKCVYETSHIAQLECLCSLALTREVRFHLSDVFLSAVCFCYVHSCCMVNWTTYLRWGVKSFGRIRSCLWMMVSGLWLFYFGLKDAVCTLTEENCLHALCVRDLNKHHWWSWLD